MTKTSKPRMSIRQQRDLQNSLNKNVRMSFPSQGTYARNVVMDSSHSQTTVVPLAATRSDVHPQILKGTSLPNTTFPDQHRSGLVNDPLPQLTATAADSTRTQHGKLLDDFVDILPFLLTLMFEHGYHPNLNTQCPCGRGPRIVTCHDCVQYDLACEECFISNHRFITDHWAMVWNTESGFFQKTDISQLRGGTFAIQFGHCGLACPYPDSSPMKMILVYPNGIHATRVQFCGCLANRPSPPINISQKVNQLMKARLFPATVRDPETAFSFSVLRDFHIHNLESKKAAYDYCGALQRLTDNAFTFQVPEPYSQFLRVARVYRFLKTLQRSGQSHGIDAHLPASRINGSLRVECPACPDPGMNMPDIPPDGLHNLEFSVLRHLFTLFWTLDGNFQLNQYMKNTDPDDVSLCNGRGQFPTDIELDEYLTRTSSVAEKSTCTYLKAANKQDKSKMKGMRNTGVIQLQCDHVFSWATVDLKLGEQFRNTDLALHRGLQQRSGPLPRMLSYDINCQYGKNLRRRFTDFFPEDLHSMENTNLTIPSVHILNHIDDCSYQFSSAYMPGAGHFHGETSEQFWSMMNEAGAYTRQMNSGHRHDSLIDQSNDLNYKKMMVMSSTLRREIQLARSMYEEKRELFISLSELFADYVSHWSGYNREFSVVDGQVNSVYRMRNLKLPSLRDMTSTILTRGSRVHPSPPQLSSVVYQDQDASALSLAAREGDMDLAFGTMLKRGILLQEEQILLRRLFKLNDEHPLQAQSVNLMTRREQLRLQIEQWRLQQAIVMAQVIAEVRSSDVDTPSESVLPEHEPLYLPSDLPPEILDHFHLKALGDEEGRLRIGHAHDCLMDIRYSVKNISILQHEKDANARHQDANTRALAHILRVKEDRDAYICVYNCTRRAMVVLGVIASDDREFRPLTVADCYRKPTHLTRKLGDSRRTDLHLYTSAASPSRRSTIPASWNSQTLDKMSRDSKDSFFAVDVRSSQSAVYTGTQQNRRQPTFLSNPARSPVKTAQGSGKPSGWIWVPASARPSHHSISEDEKGKGKDSEVAQKEITDWELDSDRVQWFRAEAEMQRWLEQVEIKHVQLMRTIGTFQKMANIWGDLALESAGGERAFAAKQSAIYARRERDARADLLACGNPDLIASTLTFDDYSEITRRFCSFREKESARITEVVPAYSFTWNGGRTFMN